MKHKVRELTGALLDAAVAKTAGQAFTLEGFGNLAHLTPLCWTDGHAFNERRGDCWAVFAPSTSWTDGGPIIDRERIKLEPWEYDSEWQADGIWGPTPLIAAMRAYVASRFGDEVDLPD